MHFLTCSHLLLSCEVIDRQTLLQGWTLVFELVLEVMPIDVTEDVIEELEIAVGGEIVEVVEANGVNGMELMGGDLIVMRGKSVVELLKVLAQGYGVGAGKFQMFIMSIFLSFLFLL